MQRLVDVGDRLDQLLAVLVAPRAQLGRESRPRGTSRPRLSSSQTIAFMRDEVDDAA